MIVLSEYSFGSTFLLKEVNLLFGQLQANPSLDALYSMIYLLGSTQRLLTPNKVRGNTDAILDVMARIPELDLRDESTALLLLMMIEQQDKTLAKSLSRRLRKLAKAHPHLFRAILPSKPRGSRGRKRRRS